MNFHLRSVRLSATIARMEITMNKENKDLVTNENLEDSVVNEHVHGPGCNHNHNHHETLKPITRAAPKVGRNDPCPCGSQKKFKKCCGQ